MPAYGRSTSNYAKTFCGQAERGPFDDLFLLKLAVRRVRTLMVLCWISEDRPIAQTLHGSIQSSGLLLFPSYSYGHGNSQPWWGNTELLNINKRNNSQNTPLTGNSHVPAIRRRSASSLGFGGSTSSNGHLGPGSSVETLLPRVTGVLSFLNHQDLFTSSADAVIIPLHRLLS